MPTAARSTRNQRQFGPTASLTAAYSLEQHVACPGWQRAQGSAVADDLENRLVEVVAAEPLDAFAQDNFVEPAGHLQQRRAPTSRRRGHGLAPLPLGGDRRAIAVAAPQARRRRLVEQRHHLEACLRVASSVINRCALDALAGTLIAASTGSPAGQFDVRPVLQVAFQLGEEACQQVGQPESQLRRQLDRRFGAASLSRRLKDRSVDQPGS